MIALALVAAQLLGTPTAECPRVGDAPRLARYSRVWRSDLDGDGRVERIWIAAAPRAPGTCAIFLVTHDGLRQRVARVPPWLAGSAARTIGEGLPRIAAAVPFGRPDRRAVAVQVHRGAGSASYVLYRADLRRLVRAIDGGVGWDGGSLHFGNVDCFRGRYGWELRQYTAQRVVGERWEYRLTTFRLEQGRIRESGASGHGNRRDVSRVQAGFSPAPFGRCR